MTPEQIRAFFGTDGAARYITERRERIAVDAMRAVVNSQTRGSGIDYEITAHIAVCLADALIKELDK